MRMRKSLREGLFQIGKGFGEVTGEVDAGGEALRMNDRFKFTKTEGRVQLGKSVVGAGN